MVNGFILSANALHHPEQGDHDNLEPHPCGLCGEYMWVTTAALRFGGMNPQIPMVCCMCADQGVEALKRAFPGFEFEFNPREVPDLANTGMFN